MWQKILRPIVVIISFICDICFGLCLFQQRISAAIMPPVAFAAVPRIPPPLFASQLLHPLAGIMHQRLQYHSSDNEDEDSGSLRDYQQQTIFSPSVLLRSINNACGEHPM